MFAVFSYLTLSYPEGGPSFLATRTTEEKALERCQQLATEMVTKYHDEPMSSTYSSAGETHTYAKPGQYKLEEMKDHPHYGHCWGIRDTHDPHEDEPMIIFYIQRVTDHE